MDSDSLWCDLYGDSAQSKMETYVNDVSSIYESNPTSICYQATLISLRTNGQFQIAPLGNTESSTALLYIHNYWAGTPPACPAIYRNQLCFMTGRDLDGNIIGRADGIGGTKPAPDSTAPNQYPYRGIQNDPNPMPYVICQDDHFHTNAQEEELISHELGHTWGAVHCDTSDGWDYQFCPRSTDACGIMTSSLGFGRTTFAVCNYNAIIAQRNLNEPVTFLCSDNPAGSVCYGWCGHGTMSEINADGPVGATIFVYRRNFDADQSYHEQLTLNRPMTYRAGKGPVTIGN